MSAEHDDVMGPVATAETTTLIRELRRRGELRLHWKREDELPDGSRQLVKQWVTRKWIEDEASGRFETVGDGEVSGKETAA